MVVCIMNDFTHDSPPFDAANPRHVQRREKAARRQRRQRDDALRWLMGDARGRRVAWDLLGRAGVFRSSMAPSPELTAFNEGRRDIGLALLADVMRLCPERYAAMQAEASAIPDVTSDATRGDNDD
jgi:hypothetical protein